MIKDIDHIGIVVKDLEKAIRLHRNLGLKIVGREDMEHLKVQTAFIQVPGKRMEPISPSTEDHELMRHIKKHGEGIHHIAYKVMNLKETLESFKKKGIHLAQDKRKGKGHGGKEIAFLDPGDTCGILIELCEEKKEK